jgi:hypothetical protein
MQFPQSFSRGGEFLFESRSLYNSPLALKHTVTYLYNVSVANSSIISKYIKCDAILKMKKEY